jgi:hypothetical protein
MTPEEVKQVLDAVNANTVLTQDMNHDLKRLNSAISGDSEYGTKGLAERVEDAEEAHKGIQGEIETLHGKISWAKGGAWAASVCLGLFAFFKDHLRFS